MLLRRARAAARLLAGAAGVAGATIVLAASAYAAEGPALRATAGIGGVAKAARWTPVKVTIDYEGQALSANLIVEWGDMTLRRAVSFASPGSRTFEFFVRTAEPAGTMHVRLRSGDVDLAAIDAPVRVLRPDEPVTLCVSSSNSAIEPSPACTVSVPVSALPSSPRGYEVVDTIAWEGEGQARTSGEADRVGVDRPKRIALEEWEAIRRLDETGDLSLTPQANRPSVARGLPTQIARVIAGASLVYLAGLSAVGILIGTRGIHARRAYLVAATVIAAATAATLAVGRIGPGSGIHVQHASLLQQIPGTPGALMTMRGIAQFPGSGTYTMQLAIADAALEPSSPSGRTEQVVGEDGYPVLSGTFGLGGRRAFLAEGVVDVQVLAAVTEGRRVRVSNRSDRPLTDCRFGDGFANGEVGELAAGASVSADATGEGLGPLFTCTMSEPPVVLRAGDRQVLTTGPTVVALYRDAAGVRTGARVDD